MSELAQLGISIILSALLVGGLGLGIILISSALHRECDCDVCRNIRGRQ